MGDVVEILVSWVVTTAAAFAVVMWDERRLRGVEAERAWPWTSRALALVFLGVPAVPVHFWRTRRSFAGVDIGLCWAAVVFAASAGAEWVTSYVLDSVR